RPEIPGNGWTDAADRLGSRCVCLAAIPMAEPPVSGCPPRLHESLAGGLQRSQESLGRMLAVRAADWDCDTGHRDHFLLDAAKRSFTGCRWLTATKANRRQNQNLANKAIVNVMAMLRQQPSD